MRDAELYQLVRKFFLNTIELLKTKIENGTRSFDRVELARVTPTRRIRRRWVSISNVEKRARINPLCVASRTISS